MDRIFNYVLEGDLDGIQSAVQQALGSGIKPSAIINDGLIKAMDEVGRRMKSGEMFVPEVLIAAETMKEGLLLVTPLMEGESYAIGKVVIGSVAGDLHDIGKNLVAMLLESAGFNVINLGVDVPEEKFLTAISEHNPDIVGLSALLTTTMAAMKNIVQTIRDRFPSVKTMIGGAPVSQEFADNIGAGGYAADGAAAVDLAKRLLN